MRREAIKCYLGLLWSEGHFKGMRSPAAIARKAGAVFLQDAAGAVGDIALTLAEQGAEHVTGKVSDALRAKFGGVVADLRKRGWGSVWEDLSRGHSDGMTALRKRAR